MPAADCRMAGMTKRGTGPVEGEVMTKSFLFGAAGLLLAGAFWIATQPDPSNEPTRTGTIEVPFSPSALPVHADLALAGAVDAH